MERKVIDARGLSCPQPVLAAKKAVEEGFPFDILLDNEVSRENVVRFAKSRGWQADAGQEGEDIVVSFRK